jgi:AcrR family transcriptional regulator
LNFIDVVPYLEFGERRALPRSSVIEASTAAQQCPMAQQPKRDDAQWATLPIAQSMLYRGGMSASTSRVLDEPAVSAASAALVQSAAPAAPGLRTAKKLSTRAALAEAALELTQQRGYDGFTIADLVERVGVSRRTFSNYYAGKAECVAAAGDRWMDAALELIDATSTDVPLTALLRQILDNLADQIAAAGEVFLCVATTEPEVAAADGAMDAARSARIAAVITARTAIAADDIRAVLLADFCLAAGKACTGRWVAAGRVGGRAALAHDLDLAFSLIDFGRISTAPR